MSTNVETIARHDRLADFTRDTRILILTLMALAIGAVSAVIAAILVRLIALVTNLAFYQQVSFADSPPTNHTLGDWVIVVPAVGGLIIGLMARYGSEKIRGHGIPEALEAILIGRSRMSPKVALLKPLSSAVSIGTGGPFGAEGPIIMTGGAFGSLFAQLFHLSAAERKTLLVAGAAGCVARSPSGSVMPRICPEAERTDKDGLEACRYAPRARDTAPGVAYADLALSHAPGPAAGQSFLNAHPYRPYQRIAAPDCAGGRRP
jgi:hypothetical protein